MKESVFTKDDIKAFTKDIKKLKENGTLIRIGGAKGGWWKVVK